MGSTVIVVAPPHAVDWTVQAADTPVRFGQALGTMAPFDGC